MATPKQVQRRGRLSLVLGTVFAALMFAALAYADQVINTLDTTIDPALETMPLTAGGATGSTKLYVKNQNSGDGDPTNACNLAGAASLTLQVVNSASAVASVSPTTITLTDCGDPTTGTQTLTVTPLTAGTANISFIVTSFTGTGLIDTAPANFTINVAAPSDGTAPTGSVSINGGAAYTNSPSASLALTATDAVGVAAYRIANGSDCSAATWVPVAPTTSFSQTVAHTLATGEGSKTVCAQYKDATGNESATATDTIVLDTLAPVILDAGVQSGTTGTNGWYVSSVTNRFTASDGGSGLTADCSSSFPKDVSTGSSEGTAVTVASGSCSDLAGNTNAGINSAAFKIDLTGPSATLAVTAGTLGSNGWYTSDVTVGTSGADLISGPVVCSSNQTQMTETAGQVFNGSCTNNAGLQTNAAPLTVKLDKTGPTAVLSVTAGTPGTNGWYTSDVTVATSGTDLISGPAVCTADQSQTAETAGQAFNGTCTNNAGLITNATPLTVKLDKTNPLVSILSPVDGSTTIATSVTVSGSDSDAMSGIDSVNVNGNAANLNPSSGTFSKPGVAISCGSNTITALATDLAGRTRTVSITVNRQCFGIQFLQPIDQSTSAAVMNKGRYGRVIPIKVLLSLAGGAALDSAAFAANGWTLQMGVNGASCSSGSGTDDIEAYADAGQSAAGTNLFRWDATAAQWIYNLDTKAPPGMTMTIGNCYRLDVYVSDGANKVLVSTSVYAVFQPTK